MQNSTAFPHFPYPLLFGQALPMTFILLCEQRPMPQDPTALQRSYAAIALPPQGIHNHTGI
jgi:hypothetical protein